LANLIARIRNQAALALPASLWAALLLASATVAQDSAAQDIGGEREALAKAKAQSAAASERAARLEARAAGERSEEDKARAQSAAVAARIQSAEADISAGEARIRLIEQLRAEQQARLAARQEPAVGLVAALQNMARRPPALALVQPGSVRDLVRVRAVLAAILPVLRARTAGLRAEIENGKRLRADADRAQAALASGQSRLKAERARLVQIATVHRNAFDRINGSAMVEQDRAIALGEKARDIVDLMDEIGESASVRARLETLPGPLLRPSNPGTARATPVETAEGMGRTLPYRLPVTGTVVTGLGEVSEAGVRARGLTIATRAGAQVVAPAAGRVVFAGPYRGFGIITIIDHGQGWTTLLTSLAALDVAVGDRVDQGSPVGRAADTSPTVTVELRRGNRPIDIANIVG
jgi:murein hydrolase activator